MASTVAEALQNAEANAPKAESKPTYGTTEKVATWLANAVQSLVKVFQLNVNPKYVRCYVGPAENVKGWRKRVNRDWVWVLDDKASKSGQFTIFVHPELGQEAGTNLLGAILHGLIHVQVGRTAEMAQTLGIYSHPAEYQAIAFGLGFMKPVTNPFKRRVGLETQLKAILDTLGAYPHPETILANYKPKAEGRTNAYYKCRCSVINPKGNGGKGEEIPQFKVRLQSAEAYKNFRATCNRCGGQFELVGNADGTKKAEPDQKAA
jgi:hypothetical protein